MNSKQDHKIWRLHINNIQESDRGWYMCQVNTDPMRSERGFLEVVGKYYEINELFIPFSFFVGFGRRSYENVYLHFLKVLPVLPCKLKPS